jgi:hypothetical protein
VKLRKAPCPRKSNVTTSFGAERITFEKALVFRLLRQTGRVSDIDAKVFGILFDYLNSEESPGESPIKASE